LEKIILRTRDFCNKETDRYFRLKDARKKLYTDMNELFKFIGESLIDSISGNNYNEYLKCERYTDTISELCEEKNRTDYKKRYVCNLDVNMLAYRKFSDIQRDLINLEEILFKGRSRKDKGNVLFSKIKNAYVSVIAGIGTSKQMYSMLNSNLNTSNKFTYSKYSVEDINTVLSIKHKYFWKDKKSLVDTIKKEKGILLEDADSIDSLVRDAMNLKVINLKYSGIERINYDSTIASQDMKMELIEQYTHSGMTLKIISEEFEKKYGMHVSISTISVIARKYLDSKGMKFKNRREAKKYYSNL
jgi:hypothetical protein